MHLHPALWRRIGYSLVGLCLALTLALPGPHWLLQIRGSSGISYAAVVPDQEVQGLLQQGRDSFMRGQLAAAADTLQAALAIAQESNSAIGEVMVLSNLALVQGQRGQWSAANNTIAASLDRLAESATEDLNWQRVRAQTLNVQGRLHLGQGQAAAALDRWQDSAEAYGLAGDEAGQIRSQLRQARALQAMGFYQRAVHEILVPLQEDLMAAVPSSIQAVGLRELAEALMVAESLEPARSAAQTSLDVAQQLRLPEDIAAAELTLGNIEYARALELKNQGSLSRTEAPIAAALRWYRLAAVDGIGTLNGVRSQLNQLALQIEFENFEQAAQLWPEIYEQVTAAAPDRAGIDTRINLAHSLEQLAAQPVAGAPSWEQILALLDTAEKKAVALQDKRAEAHVLGYLGKAYRQKGELQTAKQFIEEALFTAQSVNAADISYLWYEQLGELHEQFGERKAAIAAYEGAVATLKSLRQDLVDINPEMQFSFQKSIEPLHRKLVNLLLTEDAQPSQANLKEARAVLESLQVEELNNYLRAACINSREVSIDEISGDTRVAVVYPIVLADRLGIIVNLPESTETATKVEADPSTEESLRFYSVPVSNKVLSEYAAKMREQLVFVDYDVLDTSKQLYDLLFPAALVQDLATSAPDTLVFVPDGVLRSIPLAALFDGDFYLIEKYSVAITSGLQLLNPEPLQEKQLRALTFGLSEAVAEWSPLPNVENEIEKIGEEIPIETYLNDQFTDETFAEALANSSAPIVHLATHGKFSSQLDETFIQAWDDRISIEDLSDSLRGDRAEPLELLVLSACETATGDQRAALGLAGMAIRAGARSTVASLWQVDDAATAFFMTKFYQELSAQAGNKAEALRSAQTYLIEEFPADFDHPYYWAPFVLIGNWL